MHFGRHFVIDHHVADKTDDGLPGNDSHLHEFTVQRGLDHVSDLTLRLGHKNFQRKERHFLTILALKQRIFDLRCMAVCDNDFVFSR